VFDAPNVDGRNVADVDIAGGAYAGWDLGGGAGEYGPDWRESHIEVFGGGGELDWGPGDDARVDGGDGERWLMVGMSVTLLGMMVEDCGRTLCSFLNFQTARSAATFDAGYKTFIGAESPSSCALVSAQLFQSASVKVLGAGFAGSPTDAVEDVSTKDSSCGPAWFSAEVSILMEPLTAGVTKSSHVLRVGLIGEAVCKMLVTPSRMSVSELLGYSSENRSRFPYLSRPRRKLPVLSCLGLLSSRNDPHILCKRLEEEPPCSW